MPRPTDEQYRKAAQRMFHEEGTCEIGDDAYVMTDHGGAWVRAQVWVADSDVNDETEH